MGKNKKFKIQGYYVVKEYREFECSGECASCAECYPSDTICTTRYVVKVKRK